MALFSVIFIAIWLLQAAPRHVPRMQVVPLPENQASIQRDGVELTRYYFGPELHRPFLYPIIGPAGRPLTRMGHPHDPVTHSHHNSVWISHNSVNGDSFWDDRGPGRVVHQRILRYEDSDEEAGIYAANTWVGKEGRQHMWERRGIRVRPLAQGEWILLLDLQLEASKEPVLLGQTPFGLIGVRMAKTIGVNDGGGTIRNSEGQMNEREVFHKPSRWVDYSGAIMPNVVEGITLLDHPENPGYPTAFHVRNDGWMGASLTLFRPLQIDPGKPFRIRYGLYVHQGIASADTIEKIWSEFCKTQFPEFPTK